MKNLFCLSIISLWALHGSAQHIGFEQHDYRSVGVYDRWERSPFRTGYLLGQASVCANPDRLGNASDSVVAFVRSRQASNIFGARIDLQQPFALTPQGKAVHVLMWRPQGGRVMLVALGKRNDRPGQSPDVEQCWVYASAQVPCRRWTDAVFQIKSANGVDIHSVVVVPDAEATHNLQADWTAYIDDILIDDSLQPRSTEVLPAPEATLATAADTTAPVRATATKTAQSTTTNAAASGNTQDRNGRTSAARVTAASRNGTVLTADGQTLNNYSAPLGQPLYVRVVPAPGFVCKGVSIRYGRMLAGQQCVAGQQMWQQTYIASDHFDAAGCLVIPACCLAEEVEIEGDFVAE